MSCLACKIYEQSAWQAMTGPFIPHQLVASQQELGTERLFLISARTPAPEIFASVQLENSPPHHAKHSGGESDYSVMVTPDQLTGPHRLPDLRPLRQLYRHTLLCESKCHSLPSTVIRQGGRTLRRPMDTWTSTCARRLVHMSGTP